MKYLTHYIEQPMTDLFNRLGTFFAFSQEQFDEQRKEGVKYVHLGSGMITPKGTEGTLIDELAEIAQRGREQDLKENGKEAIIRRELRNHEATYVYSIESTIEALKGYPVTVEEIQKEFNKLIKEGEY